MHKDAIKYCQEALTYDESNPKAHYRLYLSYKAVNDLDQAKASLEQAIKLMPNDASLRQEYYQLCQTKKSKENHWRDKMAGFLNNAKLQKLETRDSQEALLKAKVHRQVLSEHHQTN